MKSTVGEGWNVYVLYERELACSVRIADTPLASNTFVLGSERRAEKIMIA